MTTWTFLTILFVWISGFTSVESGNSTCHSIYGIRMKSTGSLETVLDGARCQNADGLSTISSFLDQLVKAAVLIDLEIINSTLPQLKSGWLPGITIRRLSIQQSNLSVLSADAFKGQENSLQELDLSRNQLQEIPVCITNLTALIRLDLSRNRIQSFPPGTVFFNLLRLRHLDLDHNGLGYLDAFKLENETLPMSVFNLEPLRDHIESIRIAGNNLTTFPDQFTRLFSRLQLLDLSRNHLKGIPPEAFRQMPQLRYLNLDNNRLITLPEEWQLPLSLERVSVKGNPLRCDCSANWLWRLIHNDTNKLSMDDCRDDPWTGRHLSDLPQDFCHHRSESDNFVVTHLVDVHVQPIGPEAINITFHLLEGAPKSLTVKWTIELRRFGTPTSEASLNGDLSTGISLTKLFEGLMPSTGYEICIRLPGSGHCWEVITLAEAMYPVAEVAVAASVSGTSTFIVVVLVCCYCPRFKRNGGKKKKKLPSSAGPSPEEKKKTLITFSTTINPDDSWIRHNREETLSAAAAAEPNSTIRFSTFRAEQDGQETFRATCDYLKNKAMDPGGIILNKNRHQSYLNPVASTVYFNASYGVAAVAAQQPHGNSANHEAYKYCTWRPSRILQHPSLQRSTSYPDYLATNQSPSSQDLHQDRRTRSALAVPVYSVLDGQGRPWPARYKRPRFYWSTAANTGEESRF